ncbi:hypothetical protein FD755_017642 [Muntiacus reevesi]|uniref:Ig-like domain-containing protein n=1 Tax=Muntiacus reevesi TaxID=9886 RepID=A0A5N3XB63_MUNRE|nr:hypothetical protein FD755_017642 [Muntiacus reevesi]
MLVAGTEGKNKGCEMRLLWDFTACLLQVEMAGRTQMVFLNENVTISCKIPDSPHLDINSIGITWFQKTRTSETDTKLFEYFGNHREASQRGASVSLQSLQRGDASLQLPGVRLEDAGEYRCELVVTPQKAQGTVTLEVVAPPVSSLSKQVVVKDNEEKHIFCTSSGFYPEHINITWKKWTQKDPQFRELSKNITTDHIVENEDGTFNITSHLRLKPSLEDNGTIYQCVVWHVSLPTIQSFDFHLIIHPDDPEGRETSFLEVKTSTHLCSMCTDVFRVSLEHGEYEIEICFVCLVSGICLGWVICIYLSPLLLFSR